MAGVWLWGADAAEREPLRVFELVPHGSTLRRAQTSQSCARRGLGWLGPGRHVPCSVRGSPRRTSGACESRSCIPGRMRPPRTPEGCPLRQRPPAQSRWPVNALGLIPAQAGSGHPDRIRLSPDRPLGGESQLLGLKHSGGMSG